MQKLVSKKADNEVLAQGIVTELICFGMESSLQ
jgi:hypothetical protein